MRLRNRSAPSVVSNQASGRGLPILFSLLFLPLLIASLLFPIFKPGGPKAYAASSTITIPGTDAATQACIPHIWQDEYYNNPSAYSSDLQAQNTIPDSMSFKVFTDSSNETNASTALKNKIKNGAAEKDLADFLYNSEANADNSNQIYIYFTAKNVGTNHTASGNDARCLQGIRLFQDPSKGTHFIGWLWNYFGTTSNRAEFLDGDYQPSTKSIIIHMPSGNIDVALSEDTQEYKDFRPADYPIETILANSSLNPTGGNTNPTDACADRPVGPLYDACLQMKFLSPNSITWKHEVYTLAKWAGSGEDRDDSGPFASEGMRYYLSKANGIDHTTVDNVTNTAKRPFLQLHTDGDDNGGNNDHGGNLMPYNLDGIKGDKSEARVTEFFGAISSASDINYWGRQVLYTDYDELGNREDSVYKVADDVDGLKQVATYFSQDDPKVIGITIGSIDGVTHAGDDEKELIVPYVQDATNPRLFNAPKYYSECELTPYILLNADTSSITTLEIGTNASWNFVKKSDCSYVSTYIGVHLESGKKYADTIVIPSDINIDDSANIDLNCDFSLFNPLSWFMCPLIEGASSAINTLDGLINEQLTIPVGSDSNFDETSDAQGGASMYKAWSVMRNMALSLLVLISLIMVLSQAFSTGPFDAYTVKKVLPRIVISVIGVSLSWQICKLMISISNDLGQGVGSLISAPFAALGNPKIGVAGQSIGAVGVIAGFFTGIDLLVIASFILTGLAGVMIAFLVIAFRSILVILLVITAPLALIFWILPNTQKGWKFWKDNFGAVLLSFPIIIAFITIGRVFAAISSKGDTSLFTDIITFISYFGPYFALPAAFRLAGGAIASVGGLVNDRGKGFFDRNKKFRAGAKGKALERRQGDNTFRGGTESNLRGRFNKRVAGAYNLKNAGFRPSEMRSNLAAARATHEHDEASKFMKENHDFQSFSADDDKLWAGFKGGDSVESIAKYLQDNDTKGRFKNIETARQAAAEVLRAKKAVGAPIFNKAAVRAMAPTGTAFKDSGEMLHAINEAYGSDRSGAGKAIAEMRSASMNAGRVDLGGASYGATAGALQAMYDRPSGVSLDAAKNAATAAVTESVYQTNGANVLAHPSMKGDAVKNMVPEIQKRLQAAALKSPDEYNRELARTANLYDTLAASSPQNAEIIRLGVMSTSARSLPGGGLGPVSTTIQQDIEAARGNKAFQELRRELNAQQIQAGQTGAGAGTPIGTPPGGGAPGALGP